MAYLQEARLRPRSPSSEHTKSLETAVVGLLATLWKAGQVWGQPLMAWVEGELHVVAKTPCRDSLNPEHNSGWVVAELERVSNHCDGPVTWSARGSDHSDRSSAADWATCDAFYLFTYELDEDSSPVSAGDDGEPAPLYLLSMDERLRERLVFWMSSYKRHDSLWLESHALESAAYAEISRVDSDLSRRGRKLAEDLERALSRPVYYYLHRYHALLEGEASRPCPSCGAPWAQETDATLRGLAKFDFKCGHCRLVSIRGVDLAEPADE